MPLDAVGGVSIREGTTTKEQRCWRLHMAREEGISRPRTSKDEKNDVA